MASKRKQCARLKGYLMGFLLASKVVASTLPEAQPKTRNIFLHSKIPAK
jgi:hypothetical protein